MAVWTLTRLHMREWHDLSEFGWYIIVGKKISLNTVSKIVITSVSQSIEGNMFSFWCSSYSDLTPNSNNLSKKTIYKSKHAFLKKKKTVLIKTNLRHKQREKTQRTIESMGGSNSQQQKRLYPYNQIQPRYRRVAALLGIH